MVEQICQVLEVYTVKLKIRKMQTFKENSEGFGNEQILASLSLIIVLASCSNEPERETGEIQTLQLLKKALIVQTSPSYLWMLEI